MLARKRLVGLGDRQRSFKPVADELDGDSAFRSVIVIHLKTSQEVEAQLPRGELGKRERHPCESIVLLTRGSADEPASGGNTTRNTGALRGRHLYGMSFHSASRYADGRTDPERLLTINEVAYRLAISRDSVYRLVRSGALAHLRVGERLRFRAQDLDAYLERKTSP